MAPSPGPDDLRALYDRGKAAPVAIGDFVGDMEVIGFCSVAGEGDYILVAGQEHLAKPPDLRLPVVGGPAGLERGGLSPVARLHPGQLQRPPAGFREALEAAFASRQEGPFVRGLLAEIATCGHHAWLVGGSVRDLLLPGQSAEVKDFDLTGTIGPEALDEMQMRRQRRRNGVGNYISSLSDQNVWHVKERRDGPRLVEYKPLLRLGFTLLAWGGGLDEDVRTRDFTINALYYDWQHDVLADPDGRGRAHVRDLVLDTPGASSGPPGMANTILRGLKFLLRYPTIDFSSLVKQIEDTYPDDLAPLLNQDDWRRLAKTWDKSVDPELDGRDGEAASRPLGPKAVRLVRELRSRS